MRQWNRFFSWPVVLLWSVFLLTTSIEAQIPDRSGLEMPAGGDEMQPLANPRPKPTPIKRAPAAAATPTLTPSASPTPDEMAKLPKSGVLASTEGGQYGKSTNTTWSDVDISGDKMAPLSASVSRVGTEEWRLRVFNNGKNSYSFTVRVVQLTQSLSTSKSDSFTFSLKPGESAERTVRTGSGATGAKVILDSYKKLKTRATPSPSASPAKGRAKKK
jgi:hypothetical protein